MDAAQTLSLTVATVTRPPVLIDLSAVFLGALSGAIFASQRKFALTGVIAIAIATGLGGGIIRDILLQETPVAFTDYLYLPTAVVAAFIGFFFASLVRRGGMLLLVLDPIWMGLFAVIGAQKALNADLNSLAAMLIGCVTAFGGGVLRDIFSYEMPDLVKPGPINYLAAMAGSILYVALVQWVGADKILAEWLTIAFVFGLRLLSLKFGINAPQPVDLPAKIPVTVEGRRRRRRRKQGGG